MNHLPEFQVPPPYFYKLLWFQKFALLRFLRFPAAKAEAIAAIGALLNGPKLIKTLTDSVFVCVEDTS